MNKESVDVINDLCRVYTHSHEIGLVLGAGVTKDSNIPDWKSLSLKLFEEAIQQKCFKAASPIVTEFLNEEVFRLKNDQMALAQINPDRMLQFVCNHIEPKQIIPKLIKDILYKNIELKSHNMVGAGTYRNNRTLDAIISFCASAKGSSISQPGGGRWGTNSKVVGILTTNYDNLVEASFNSKYKKHLLHPVARQEARESFGNKRIIPVYHMHGYVSYRDDKNSKSGGGVKASELVLTEKDYYQTFFNHLHFNNIVASSFFRRFNCVFIGCSMTDPNIRRILYQVDKERIAATETRKHFAILPRSREELDYFEDALLASFGVTAIRLSGKMSIGEEIESILQHVYLAADGIIEDHWKQVMKS